MTSENGSRWQLQNHEERLKALEALNIQVIADRLERLSAQVGWMIGTFVTLIFSVLTALIIFLLTRGH